MDRIPIDKRLEQRRRDDLTPIREQRTTPDRRVPEWIRRAREHQLPTKVRWAA